MKNISKNLMLSSKKRIRATNFYREGLVQFASGNRLILAIDNKSGGAEEVDTLKIFRTAHAETLQEDQIPAMWLVLSLYLCKQERGLSTLKIALTGPRSSTS